MESCGLAGLRAGYPDAESVESCVYRRDTESGEIIDTGALIDADADLVEFDLPELCAFDLLTVIVLPVQETEETDDTGVTGEGTKAPEGEGDIDSLDPALTDGGSDLIGIPDTESGTDSSDNADGTDMTETAGFQEEADIPETADSAEGTQTSDDADPAEGTEITDDADPAEGTEITDDADPAGGTEITDDADPAGGTEIADDVESTDRFEISDAGEETDLPDTADDTATPPAAGEEDGSGDQHPAAVAETAGEAGAAGAKTAADAAEEKETDRTDPALSTSPSEKKTPGASQEIFEPGKEESDAEERRNDVSNSGKWGTCDWEIDSEGTLTVRPGDEGNEGESQAYKDYSPWNEYIDSIEKIVFEEKNGQKVALPLYSHYLFCNLTNVESMNLSGCDTSSVEDMEKMFAGCSALKSLDVSDWDTGAVTNMWDMFNGCGSLESLDVSDWDTESVTNIGSMFAGCSALTRISIGENYKIKSDDMFPDAPASGGYNGQWYSPKYNALYNKDQIVEKHQSGGVADTYLALVVMGTWGDCPWYITTDGTLTVYPGDSGNTGASQAGKDYSPWKEYKDSIKKVVFEEKNGKKVQLPSDSQSLFRELTNVKSMNLSECDTSSVENMTGTFEYCLSLESLDISDWNTSSVENMTEMFCNCSSLKSLDVSNWNTESVTEMNYTFSGCSSLKSLDVSNWNTESVTEMKNTFSNCRALKSLDVSDWETGSVTDMEYMFSACSALESLDVSDWDTSKLTDTGAAFGGCSALESLDVSDWNTESVTEMNYTFYGCSSLKSLDVSDWGTGSVEIMDYMFAGCSALESLDVSDWETGSVEIMDYMFADCSALKSLDVSDWETGSVTNMSGMFSGCSSLKSLDVSDWETGSVTSMSGMFSGCSALTRITIGKAYTFCSADGFPDATASNGKWYSCAESEWYSKDEIVNGRSGIADTYINDPGLIRLKVTKSVSVSGGNPDIGNKDFEFTVTQKNGNKTQYYDTNGKEIQPGSDGEIPENGIHKVKSARLVSFIDLQPGTYTVTELDTNAQIKGYDLTPTADGGVSVVVSDGTFSTVTLTNKYTKKLEVTARDYEGTYNGKPCSITVDLDGAEANVYYSTEELTADNCSTDGSTVNPSYTDAGTYNVYFYVDAPRCNPTSQKGMQTVTIKKASAACTAPKARTGLVYSGKAQTLVTAGSTSDGTLQYSLTKDGTFASTLPAGTKAGTYTVYYKVAGDKNHKDAAVLGPVSVTIGKAASACTAAPKAKTGLVYSGKAQTLVTAGSTSDGTLQYSLTKDGTFASSLPTGTNIGSYTVYYKVKGNKNHNDSAVKGPVSVTIGKAASTCTAPKARTGLVYSGKAQTLVTAGSTSDGTLQYSLKKDGTFSSTLPAGTKAGTYSVYYKVKGDKNHKDSAVKDPVSVTIAKAKITITARNKTGAREASIKKLTYKVSGAYVSGDSLGIKLSTTAKKTSRPGKYPISVSWNKNPNYKAALTKGTYTITDRLTAAESSRARIRLNAGFKAVWNGSALRVDWGKVQDADLYEIRAAYCGKEMKTVRTIKGNSVFSYKITKLDGKKINRTNNIKVRVYVFRKVNGKLTRISSTFEDHVTGGHGISAAFTNAK